MSDLINITNEALSELAFDIFTNADLYISFCEDGYDLLNEGHKRRLLTKLVEIDTVTSLELKASLIQRDSE